MSVRQRAVAAVAFAVAAVSGISLVSAARPAGPQFQRVYPLKPAEGVFAYARISPDGKLLAYASEITEASTRVLKRTVTVVDLAAQKTLFTEPGIDAYWSNDNQRMIYLSMQGMGSNVSMRHQDTGEVTRGVAPVPLGDYFSWAVRDGKNLILTIQSNYYYLDGDKGIMPNGHVPSCPGIGTGDRPLISKDGQRITTFVRGAIVVRDLTDCDNVFDTGIQGAKADFSWDNRYVAFHVAKPTMKGYDIQIVDTEKHTVRTMTSSLAGSSLFPSWTKDGRLCFRYDGDDYRGFMMVDHPLDVPEQPLPPGGAKVPANPRWADLFPETPAPASRVALVMIWATWSAHSPQALIDLQRAGEYFKTHAEDASVTTALEIGSLRPDVERMRRANGITLPEIPLAPKGLQSTEALNQIPTTLLFRDGVMVDRRLGAQSFEDLTAWVGQALGATPAARR
jgi:hypothetical protein